jgi:hypothetical protein
VGEALAANRRARHNKPRRQTLCPLIGRVVDAEGAPMPAASATAAADDSIDTTSRLMRCRLFKHLAVTARSCVWQPPGLRTSCYALLDGCLAPASRCPVTRSSRW